jgi:hypothetical protein
MGRYFIGLDLGQRRDFTALAVLEKGERDGAPLRLRYLERMTLGTAYPDVAERVRQVAWSRELRGKCNLVLDATGCGRPVVDLLHLLHQHRP